MSVIIKIYIRSYAMPEQDKLKFPYIAHYYDLPHKIAIDIWPIIYKQALKNGTISTSC